MMWIGLYFVVGLVIVSALCKFTDVINDTFDFVFCVILWPIIVAIIVCATFGELIKMYIDWLKDQ